MPSKCKMKFFKFVSFKSKEPVFLCLKTVNLKLYENLNLTLYFIITDEVFLANFRLSFSVLLSSETCVVMIDLVSLFCLIWFGSLHHFFPWFKPFTCQSNLLKSSHKLSTLIFCSKRCAWRETSLC